MYLLISSPFPFFLTLLKFGTCEEEHDIEKCEDDKDDNRSTHDQNGMESSAAANASS